MTPTAKTIFSALEFRKPMVLRNIEPLSEAQMLWRPGPQRVSIAWQLWHIAEVEDNWIRALVTDEPLRYPFGVAQREAANEQYPSKADLLAYFHEVRAITAHRLQAATEAGFDRPVHDDDFGELSVRDVWSGVITGFAWHAGQIALTAKLIPDTPVETLQFKYWKSQQSGGGGQTPNP
jgi:uncharacterized damage-inducible protein DinB